MQTYFRFDLQVLVSSDAASFRKNSKTACLLSGYAGMQSYLLFLAYLFPQDCQTLLHSSPKPKIKASDMLLLIVASMII